MVQPDSFTKFLDSTGKPLQKRPDVIRPSTNGFILNERGEVLLQRRADNGFWGMPGGNFDIGESAEQCVIREVFEETGLWVRMKRLTGIYSDPNHYSILSYPNGLVVQYVTLVFECERQSGELQISEESTAIGYFPPEALPADTLLSHRLRIKDALTNQAEPFIR
jgi:ADP-ribose pyrophosphatase YjhB (NUDIX family)